MNKTEDFEYREIIKNWADSWKGFHKDVEYGKMIIDTVYIPFIEHMISKGLAKRTIKRHLDNLWLLGGELIDRINFNEELRNLKPKLLVLSFIDDDGGPFSKHNDSEESMRSYDSTCRKLYKFLIE